MIGLHDEVNERVEAQVVTDLVDGYRPELAAFLGGLGLAHLLEEVFVPLCKTARVKAAVSYEERPWPPTGVGSKALRGLAIAVLSDDGGRALLTPPLLAPRYATNIGLASALTKILLEDLASSGVASVAIFVNDRSKVVAGELTDVGFVPGQARMVTGHTHFTAYEASPVEVLQRLGLAKMRLGDVLAFKVDRSHGSRLTSFHLSLAAGIANHWADRTEWAEVIPGLIEAFPLPPGGIGGTSKAAPKRTDPAVAMSK